MNRCKLFQMVNEVGFRCSASEAESITGTSFPETLEKRITSNFSYILIIVYSE